MKHLIVAEFASAETLTRAAQSAAHRGHRAQDALTPYPLPEIWEHLSHRPKRPIGWVMFAAGLSAALAIYLMQWFSATVDYPIISGGRPLHSWQVFLLIVFEACILFASFAGFVAYLRDCRLPSLHHPLFEIRAIERASQDRFFLVFETVDEERTALLALIPAIAPLATHEVAL
jgi:hypothetical protein